jgi:hypothetical protein
LASGGGFWDDVKSIDANPVDYLTEVQRHAAELKRNPAAWMPWNYRETLAQLAAAA